MSRPGAATAEGRARTVRRSPAPRLPRRVSGPGRRIHAPVATGRGAALPARRAAAGFAGGAGFALRVVAVGRGLPSSRLMDRLVRSRLWIGIIAVALAGIVAMQVSMLKLNAGLGRAVESAATLERQNAALRMQVSRLSTGERVREVAQRRGLVMPAPNELRYLSAGDRARRRPPCRPDHARPQAARTADARRHAAGPGRDAGLRRHHPADRRGNHPAEHVCHRRAHRRAHRRGRASDGGAGVRCTGGVRPADRARSVVGAIERRIGLLFAVFLVLLAVGVARAVWLGGVKAATLQRAAVTQQVDEFEVPARRGTIFDRRGIELAVSEPAADIAATPYLVKDPARAAERLAPLLERDADDLLRKLTRRDTGFVYLARKVPATRARRARRLKIAGLQSIPTVRRDYPRDWLAAQVIGGVGTDNSGLSGLEYAHDEALHGRDGQRRIVKDALGDAISLRETEHASAGKDLRLTLDAGLQDKVEAVLSGVGQKFRPRGATAVVMDPNTGEVLALGNWPLVDANDLGGAPPYAAQNRAVGFNHEPGSTFKAFTVAGALEDGRVKPDDMFHLPPKITVADREIGEAHERGPIDLTTTQILAQSSNVGTILIGQKLGARRFDRWVRRFGFGRPTGVELPGEERGQVLRLGRYSGSSMGNLPIGQGESVTPMQLAAAYSAIANGGILRRPRIVDRIDGRPVAHRPGRRIVSRETADRVRVMLEGVLDPGGTASEVAIDGYALAGKTGTANKVDEATGLYSKSRYIASFVGFAPARRPKLLVTVMVDEPQGGVIAGSDVAAPAFEEITRFALPYLGIAPD